MLAALVCAMAVAAAAGVALAGTTPIPGRHFTKITTPAALAGTWRLCVCPDGTYDLTRAMATGTLPTVEFQGAWTRSVSKLTFKDSTGCTGAGVYTWNLAGRHLTFRAVHDACSRRKLALTNGWTRF
jgi:hypothetical protein